MRVEALGQIPKRGMRFLHSRQITKDCSLDQPVPETCTITRVTRLAIYFRNSTGFLSYATPENFHKSIKEWV